MKYLIAAMLMVLSVHVLADDFSVAGGWKLSVDGGLAMSSFNDSDTQTKCDGVTQLLLNNGWSTAKSTYTNTPGMFNGGVSIGYDLGKNLYDRGWSTLLGAGYRYYGGPESVIVASASGSGASFNAKEDTTTDIQSFYIFSQPTFNFDNHHAIFFRCEAGLSELNYQDNYIFYNNSYPNPNSSLNETDMGLGEHFAGLVGYQFTPWRHFAFNVSTGLHVDYITGITIQDINSNNWSTSDKVGDTLMGNDGKPLAEVFMGVQSNISASFIW